MSRSARRTTTKGHTTKGCRLAAITLREDRKARRYGWEV